MVHRAFAYPFMQNALITALLVSIICAMLSCYLVLKGWSLMGDAISHAVLPGIVVAFWLSLPLTIGAFVAGLLCSVCVGYLKENSRIKEDTAMGIVFSGMFALGIVLFSKIETDQHLTHILFGNLLGVSDAEMLQTLVISAVVFGVVFLRRKDFLLYCFDATQAKNRWLIASTLALQFTDSSRVNHRQCHASSRRNLSRCDAYFPRHYRIYFKQAL